MIRHFVLIAGPPALADPVIASRLKLIEQIKAKDTKGRV